MPIEVNTLVKEPTNIIVKRFNQATGFIGAIADYVDNAASKLGQPSEHETQQQTFRDTVTNLFATEPSLNDVIDSTETSLFTDLSEGKVTPIIPATTVASSLEDNNLTNTNAIEESDNKWSNWSTFFSKKPAVKDTDTFNLNLAFTGTSSGSNTNTWMDTEITTDIKQRSIKIEKDRDLVAHSKTLSAQLTTAFDTAKGLSEKQQATEDWFIEHQKNLWLFDKDVSDTEEDSESDTTSQNPALASASYYGRLAALTEESIANETAKISANTWNTPDISTLSYNPRQQKKSTNTVYNPTPKKQASVLKYSAPPPSSSHKLAATDSSTSNATTEWANKFNSFLAGDNIW